MMPENVTLSLMRPLNTLWWALHVLQKASERRLSNAERFASQREMYKVELSDLYHHVPPGDTPLRIILLLYETEWQMNSADSLELRTRCNVPQT